MAMSNHYLPSESMIELAYEQGESITAEAKQVLDKFGLSRSINPNSDDNSRRDEIFMSNALGEVVLGALQLTTYYNATLGNNSYRVMDSNRKFDKSIANSIMECVPINNEQIFIEALQNDFFEYASRENGKLWQRDGRLEVKEEGVYFHIEDWILKEISKPPAPAENAIDVRGILVD